MSIKVDQNGVPSIVTAKSSTNGKTLGADIVSPTVASVTFGQLVNDLLGKMTNAATIIIDPVSRSVWAGSGAAGDALSTAAYNQSQAEKGTVEPDTGQTGKSLTWKALADIDGLTQETQAAITASIEATKPKRSVQSLVSAIFGGSFGAKLPIIVVDQPNGVVTVMEEDVPGTLATALDSITPSVDQVKLTITEPPTSTTVKLAFEGGAIGA